MFEIFGVSSSTILGTFLGYLLCTAFCISVLGLILQVIIRVVQTVVIPLELLARTLEHAANKKVRQEEKKAQESQEASIYNSPFTRF